MMSLTWAIVCGTPASALGDGTVRLGEVYRRAMAVTRKELLAGSAALALAGCGGSGKKQAVAARTLSGWAAAKAQFALDPKDRHFDGFLFAAHPRVVREAIDRHRRGFDSGANQYLHEHEEEAEKAVASNAAAYLGVNPGELAFVDSTTMG